MKMAKNCLTNIIQSFFDFARQKGFCVKERSSLISPYFESDFNLSAGHQYVVPILFSPERKKSERIAINEPCFRRIDLQRIGYSPCHLLLFEMGVIAVLGYTQSKGEWVTDILKFSIDWLTSQSLSKEKLIFSISGGATILGTVFEKDTISYNALLDLGCPLENIVWTKGRRNFIYSHGINRPAGRSIEIFYKAEKKFVEVASLNIYTHILKNNFLKKSQNIAVGAGFGFERISYLVNSHDNAFQIDPFSRFMAFVRQYFESELDFSLSDCRLSIIGELLKSLVFVIGDGQLPDQSGRGKIIRKLAKTLSSEINYLNLPPEEIIAKGTRSFAESYYDRYPHLLKNIDLITNTVLCLITKGNGGSGEQ